MPDQLRLLVRLNPVSHTIVSARELFMEDSWGRGDAGGVDDAVLEIGGVRKA